MDHAAQLWLFFAIVFGVVLLPGLDMAYVLGCGLTRGRGSGLCAVGGIMAGGALMVTLTTLGIGVFVKTIPGAFNALLLAGAAYLAWIGFSIFSSRSGFGAATDTDESSRWLTFRCGMFTSLLNPKAYLFLLAVFPQFLHPANGPIWSQALVLWLIIAATQAGVYGTVALASHRLHVWLSGKSAAGMLTSRVVGAALIGAALLTGYEGLHAW